MNPVETHFVAPVGFNNIEESLYHEVVDFCCSKVLAGTEKGIIVLGKTGFPLAVAEAGIQLGIPVMILENDSNSKPSYSNQFYFSRYRYVLENSAHKKFIEYPNHWMLNYLSKKMGKLYLMWDGGKGEDALIVRSAERYGIRVTNFWNKFWRKL